MRRPCSVAPCTRSPGTSLVAPDADRLTCTPEQLVHMLRMLTFSGTHPHISDGHLLTPDQIADLVAVHRIEWDT